MIFWGCRMMGTIIKGRFTGRSKNHFRIKLEKELELGLPRDNKPLDTQAHIQPPHTEQGREMTPLKNYLKRMLNLYERHRSRSLLRSLSKAVYDLQGKKGFQARLDLNHYGLIRLDVRIESGCPIKDTNTSVTLLYGYLPGHPRAKMKPRDIRQAISILKNMGRMTPQAFFFIP